MYELSKTILIEDHGADIQTVVDWPLLVQKKNINKDGSKTIILSTKRAASISNI